MRGGSSLPFRARGDELAVRAVVVTRTGGAVGIRLGTTTANALGRAVPRCRARRPLVSFIFDLTNTGLHGVPNGGINAAALAQGTLQIGRPARTASSCRSISRAGPVPAASAPLRRRQLRYVVTGNDVARFRARQPTDDKPIPIVVSPTLAAAAGPGGILPVDVATGTIVGRVVGTVRRIPTVDEDVVIADGATLATALAPAPAPAPPNEVWLDAATGPRGRGRGGAAPPALQRARSHGA